MTTCLPGSRYRRPQLPGWAILAPLLAVFLACYASVWNNDYGITDDYPDFFYGTEGTHPEKRVIEGRPLYAAIGYVFTSLATELEDLRWIRLIGIAGIALLASGGRGQPVPAGRSRHLSARGHVLLGVRRHPSAEVRGGGYMLRRLAWYCMVVASGMVLAFALYKLGPTIYPDSHYASRGGLIPIEDIPERIAWFVHPVKDALNFLLLQEMYRGAITLVTIALSLFIATGLILHFRGRLGQRLLKWGLALAFLFLSHAIMLVVERHAGGYRVLAAPVSLVVLYLFFASKGYAFHMARFLSPVRVNAIAGIAAAICVLVAAWQVQVSFVTPQVKELAFIRSELSGEDLSKYRGIHVIRPGPFDGFVPVQYAAASSRFPWAVPPMVGFVLRDLAPAYAGLPVTHSAFDDPSPPPQGSLVVDIGKGIAASP